MKQTDNQMPFSACVCLRTQFGRDAHAYNRDAHRERQTNGETYYIDNIYYILNFYLTKSVTSFIPFQVVYWDI